MTMLTVIIYRIKNNKLRNKLRKFLLGYGYVIQNSVFEMRLTKEQRQKVIAEIKQYEPELEKGDSIYFYQLCKSCVQKSFVLGEKTFTADPLFYLI